MSEGSSAPAATPANHDESKSVFLVSHPKILFMYPTLIAALVAGVYSAIAHDVDQNRSDTPIVAAIFLAIFALNLVVFAFDFPRTTSLTLFFFVAVLVLGSLLLFRMNEQIVPFLSRLLNEFQPRANATFYFSIAAVLGLIFMAVALYVRLDYWEVTANELLHHHGVLSDLERFSAPQLKVDKEINDVFEYLLLGSGRMILHPSNEPRAIVLDNVLFINKKEEAVTKLLGALQVKIQLPS